MSRMTKHTNTQWQDSGIVRHPLVCTAFLTEFGINGDQKTLIETLDEADKYLQVTDIPRPVLYWQ